MPTIMLRFSDLKRRGIVNSWPVLRRRVERDGFPPGRMLGPNTRAWTEEEVQVWIDSRPTAKKLGRNGELRTLQPEAEA